jgi:glycosyltransferase involved in cell wall biosynthesis
VKKVLYITESSIKNDSGGGGEGVRKVYSSVQKYCRSNGFEFATVSLDVDLDSSLRIKLRKNRIFDTLVRFVGHSNYMFLFQKRIMKALTDFNPDVVILGRSRYGFLSKAINEQLPDCKIITVFENVELDYIDAHLSGDGIVDRLKRSLEFKVVKGDEYACLKHSDVSVFLSTRDLKRTREIYGNVVKQYHILPVCLKIKPPLVLRLPVKTLVFTGSLWYRSNIEAVEWLLDNIIPCYLNVQFVIGGTRPSEQLTSKIKSYKNVLLYSGFADISDIVPCNALFLSPTFHGAGMKVKIAEALSLGLPIVGTDESFVGYDEVMALDGVFLANNAQEFKSAIDKYLTMSDEELAKIEAQNKEAFLKYYDYSRAETSYKELLNNLLGDNYGSKSL